MSIELKTNYGQIDISNDAIATLLAEPRSNAMVLSVWHQSIKLEMV